MSIPLDEILAGEPLRLAGPAVVAGASALPQRRVRWVHSSEVVQIAPLLRGGELLLTGGQAFLDLRLAAQREYVRSLAERSVAGVAIETVGRRGLPAEVLAAADGLCLPLIELRRVVPFVEVAEAVNRRIVSRQVEALQAADALSQRMAERMAVSGSSLGPLLRLAADALGATAVVVDSSGSVLEAAGNGADGLEGVRGGAAPEDPVIADVALSVGGVDVARLELRAGEGADLALIETVAPRIRGILALALAQHHRPSLARMADDALLRMVVLGGGGDRLLELAEAAGLGLERPVAVAVFRSSSPEPPAAAVERAVRATGATARLHADGDTALALLAFEPAHQTGGRAELVSVLRDALARTGTVGALGPTVPSIRGASASLREARATLRLGRASKWDFPLYDSADFVVERFAERELTRSAAESFVHETLGAVIDLERRRGGELVRTLDVWITAGCNTADAARTLFLERQSLHKRLARIFDVLGGDPRGTGRLGALAFAVKLARGNAQLRDTGDGGLAASGS